MEGRTLYEFTTQFSRQLLLATIGNSGTILSQIFKGFFEPITPEMKEIDVKTLIEAFSFACKIAYKVVPDPKEGTMLTVIRVVSEHLKKNIKNYNTVEEVFLDVISVGDDTVKKTMNMLPELKKAKNVDSGAYGLVVIFKGMYDALVNKDIANLRQAEKIENKLEIVKKEKIGIDSEFVTSSEDDYGYCCEFVLEIGASLQNDEQKEKLPFDPQKVVAELKEVGNSLVFVYDDVFCKVHVHSLFPYKILKIGQQYGEYHRIKVENMTLQRNRNNNKKLLNNQKQEALKSTQCLVATVPNDDIEKLFRNEFNVKYVINRKNSLAPSVRQFIELIHETRSNKVIVVIDNSDYFLAANEAKKDVANENINVEIIDAKDIVSSLFAILSFNTLDEFNVVIKRMQATLKKITSAKVAVAGKEIVLDKNIKIKKGNYILVQDKKVINGNPDFFKIGVEAIDLIIKKKKKS
ncbi:DAK2 domain-containing protein [bacterium]|nr:DAK2 domain-containing protein [bacterium]